MNKKLKIMFIFAVLISNSFTMGGENRKVNNKIHFENNFMKQLSLDDNDSENEISLYLYHGKIETDYDETDCYFYQFVFLKNDDYELNLEIRNEENIVYNVNPADYNYLGRIEKEGFNFTKTLEITVLNFDEEILYDKINL